MCLSTTTVVLTAQILHAMTKVLFSGSHSCACGKVGFPLPPEQAAAVDLYSLVGLYFGTANYITHIWLSDNYLLAEIYM
jgi:hypothetical protein